MYRKIVRQVLSDLPDVEVVGTAPNGRIALQKIEQLRPDLITLDVEMPVLDGLEVLRELPARGSPVGVIMVNALAPSGARLSAAVLHQEAFDVVCKPTTCDRQPYLEELRQELSAKITAFRQTLEVRRSLRNVLSPAAPSTQYPVPSPQYSVPRDPRTTGDSRTARVEAIAIGISTGGPEALARMLPQLPADLGVPVLVVQHMPAHFTRSLAQDLDRRCLLDVREAQDGMPIQAGTILIAPGSRQMKAERAGDQPVVRITDDPPEQSCRPSVDYLFRSVADVYGPAALAVIMTGMGHDGTAGCGRVKQRGGVVLAQDAASCVVYGMPRKPVELGLADAVVPLDQMAAEIVRRLAKGGLQCI
jgi:two-component system chemotaxis response regulator CheB